jgi:hypothetical protein
MRFYRQHYQICLCDSLMIVTHTDYAIAFGQALPGALAWGAHQYLLWVEAVGYHAADNTGGHITASNKCD